MEAINLNVYAEGKKSGFPFRVHFGISDRKGIFSAGLQSDNLEEAKTQADKLILSLQKMEAEKTEDQKINDYKKQFLKEFKNIDKETAKKEAHKIRLILFEGTDEEQMLNTGKYKALKILSEK